MKNKITTPIFLFFALLCFLSLLRDLNNYEIYLHDIDLNYNILSISNELNKRNINNNLDTIKDYYLPEKKTELFKMYINAMTKLRRLILSIIFETAILGFLIAKVIKNGNR